MSARPIISIVTITWNDHDGLVKTFQSIQEQSFRDFEYIVIDGASTDETKGFLESKSSEIDCLVSEADNGIYDAMNKGTERASGDWILYVNAGDTLSSPNSLELAVAEFKLKDHVYCGRGRIEFESKKGWLFPPKCISNDNFEFWLYNNLPIHQAIFFPKNFYEQNRYRLDLKISADSDFKERALSCFKYTFIDQTVSCFALGGISTERTIKSQITQAGDRYKRFKTPKKYIDFPISLTKSMIRYLSYRIFGDKSYFLIHWLKTRFDCARTNLLFRIKK